MSRLYAKNDLAWLSCVAPPRPVTDALRLLLETCLKAAAEQEALELHRLRRDLASCKIALAESESEKEVLSRSLLKAQLELQKNARRRW